MVTDALRAHTKYFPLVHIQLESVLIWFFVNFSSFEPKGITNKRDHRDHTHKRAVRWNMHKMFVYAQGVNNGAH
jgi:hypothetical protein